MDRNRKKIVHCLDKLPFVLYVKNQYDISDIRVDEHAEP
jgi:hypothetical protein